MKALIWGENTGLQVSLPICVQTPCVCLMRQPQWQQLIFKIVMEMLFIPANRARLRPRAGHKMRMKPFVRPMWKSNQMQ